ncbi:zinc finger, CCHC-type containing protein [Tanacetum coccineum]
MVPEVDPDYKQSFAFSLSWVVLAVSVETLQSNPSPLFALYTISPLKVFGLSVLLTGKRVIGVMGRWEVVRGRLGDVLGRWFGAKNHGRGCIEEDPRTYNEAMQSRDAAFWKEAIDDEIGSIKENNTWILSDLPPGCKPLDKRKDRLSYDTYAPVARITTIRLLLALAAIHNIVIHQMDLKTAFLNGDLDEEVYMKQPE